MKAQSSSLTRAESDELTTLVMLETSCKLRGYKLSPELAFRLHQLRRKVGAA